MSIRPSTHKTISDPLYGSIPLTRVEVQLIDTQAFQRLRRIGQLGLADRVFPSADYSRFAHSIGACHVLGMFLDVLGTQKESEVAEVWQEHRVAMLLHDIGHYPMSHATEKAVEKYYKNSVVSLYDESVSLSGGKTYLNHERVGAKVLLHNREVREVLEAANLDPAVIGRIFAGEETSLLRNLVTSELDADRLDYLMRSSQATGLPYGNYDRDYIIQNLSFDSSGEICLRSKALRAADHYLMCRTFDYLQTIFHKVIVGMEQMLQHCVLAALDHGILELSDHDVITAVENEEWLDWDDNWLLKKLQELEGLAWDDKSESMAKRLRLRKPPPCLWQEEMLARSRDKKRGTIRDFLQEVEQDQILNSLTITWSKGFSPTDVSPSTRARLSESDDPDKLRKLIRVQDSEGGSTQLVRHQNSLMRIMGEYEYVFGRVYFVGDDSNLEKAKQRMAEIAVDCDQASGLRVS